MMFSSISNIKCTHVKLYLNKSNIFFEAIDQKKFDLHVYHIHIVHKLNMKGSSGVLFLPPHPRSFTYHYKSMRRSISVVSSSVSCYLWSTAV